MLGLILCLCYVKLLKFGLEWIARKSFHFFTVVLSQAGDYWVRWAED